MNKKRNLIIIEGQDRVGKDYLFQKLNIPGVYKYKSKAKDYPNYREDPEGFRNWVAGYLIQQQHELLELKEKNIMMVRFLYSEFVYSKLFKRRSMVANDIYKRISQEFNIYQIIMLFANYTEYKDRCEMLGEPLEYEVPEFYEAIRMFDFYVSEVPATSKIYKTALVDPDEVEEYIISCIGNE